MLSADVAAAAPPRETRITAGRRILALTGMGVVGMLAIYLASLGILSIIPESTWLLFAPVALVAPYGVAYVLGAESGRSLWWEGAVAAVLAMFLAEVIRNSVSLGLMTVASGDPAVGFGYAALAVALGVMRGSLLGVALIVLAAFLGGRRGEVPSARAGSAGWRRVGFVAWLTPAVILILALLPAAVAPG